MEQFPREVLVDWAARTPEVMALHVFGSRARGTALCYSDLDLAIELIAKEDEQMLVFVDRRQRWIDELSELTGFLSRSWS
jgi:predicted nucleotidyltransferase